MASLTEPPSPADNKLVMHTCICRGPGKQEHVHNHHDRHDRPSPIWAIRDLHTGRGHTETSSATSFPSADHASPTPIIHPRTSCCPLQILQLVLFIFLPFEPSARSKFWLSHLPPKHKPRPCDLFSLALFASFCPSRRIFTSIIVFDLDKLHHTPLISMRSRDLLSQP